MIKLVLSLKEHLVQAHAGVLEGEVLTAWLKELQKEYDRTEDNIKALQSVGQIIGEVLKQLDDERCENVLLPVALFRDVSD